MTPRYIEVARNLTAAIASQRYPVGTLLPNELELAEQFSVSRSTIRAAMRELLATGLISRKRRAGTRVEASKPASNPTFIQALGSIEDVQQFGLATIRQIKEVREVEADVELSAKLGCRSGTQWLRISSLRLAADDLTMPPLCWTDVYVAEDFSNTVRVRMEDHPGIFGTLIEEYTDRKIFKIVQDIRAIETPSSFVHSLGVKRRSPALEFRRRYFLEPEELAQVSISVYPGDHYLYTTTLARRS